jgi:hypothetical protein
MVKSTEAKEKWMNQTNLSISFLGLLARTNRVSNDGG